MQHERIGTPERSAAERSALASLSSLRASGTWTTSTASFQVHTTGNGHMRREDLRGLATGIPVRIGVIVRRSRLGGQLKSYSRRAA